MSVSEYSHVLTTWAVYPRVHYFQKRFRDLYKRFNNVTSKGQFAVLFKKPDLTTKLDALRDDLEQPLEVIVIGKDNLNVEDFVISTEPINRQHQKSHSELTWPKTKKTTTAQSGITIVVCNAKIQDVDESGLQEVVDTLNHFASHTGYAGKTHPALVDFLFIECELEKSYSEQALHSFRREILEELMSSSLHVATSVSPTQIIVGLDGETLSSKISEVLESRIVEGIVQMKTYLASFVRNSKEFNTESIDILETDHMIDAMQIFLKNGLGFVDMLEDKTLPFIDLLLRSYARVIRCAIVGPISSKYNLPQDTSNRLAHEIKFEESVIGSITTNTRHHLSDLQEPCEEMVKATKSGNNDYQFPGHRFVFIAYLTAADIRTVVMQFEKSSESMQNSTTVMHKMIFEIDGYLLQSVAEQADVKNGKTETTISDQLRRDILAISGVYAVGTLYGKLEIHASTNIIAVKEAISELMVEHKFHYPYHVRSVIQFPRVLAGRVVEHGGTIECPSTHNKNIFRKGTLGGFVDSNDNQLYALTCAHVVSGEGDIERGVFIKNGSDQRQLFAMCHPTMTILSGEEPNAFIDIAAAKVINNVRHKCTKFLKDDDGMETMAKLSTENPNQLFGREIFKYGASTNFTRGIVCAYDYCLFNAVDANDYFVLIDCLPGSVNEPYAKPGDSGAINCIVSVEKNKKTITAVSMLSAGEFELEGFDNKLCLSFLLSKGLEKLKISSGGVELTLPTECMHV